MRLFNPFGRHVVQFENGKYGVRKLTSIGWMMRATDEEYWWYTKDCWPRYCYFDTENEARQALMYKKPSVERRDIGTHI